MKALFPFCTPWRIYSSLFLHPAPINPSGQFGLEEYHFQREIHEQQLPQSVDRDALVLYVLSPNSTYCVTEEAEI